MAVVTGQITLVDLTDERVSSFYLQANQSKIQVYDTNTKTYNPDYEIINLVIEPFFFFGAEDYSSKLSSDQISYTINGSLVGSFSGAVQNGAKLIISQNINTPLSTFPFNSDTLKIVAIIKENGITDEKTGISNGQIITADIEFAKVSTGLQGVNGVGVSDVNQLYLLTSNSTEIPDTPDKNTLNWSENNPSWDNTKVQYLWICTEIIYTDNSKTYSTPYTDSNWKTATEAVQNMEQSFGTLRSQVETLQGEVDSAIETWYLEGTPSLTTPPWGQEENNKHIGDLYYDIKTGYSYRFFEKTPGIYEWTRISDSDVVKALDEVSKLQTVVDGKVTIYYDSSAPSPSSYILNIDDLWMPPNGNFHRWDGTKWVLANEIIDKIEIQYNKNQSNTIPPNSEDPNWSSVTPNWEEGYYIWQRTSTFYKEKTNPVFTAVTCISVAGAKGEDGQNAIFAIVESTSKLIFTNEDKEDIILNANLYIGGQKVESDINYNWTSIPSGAINNSTSSSIIVKREDVVNLKTYICTITYNNKEYKDRITITDKIDPIYCVIRSTGGDKFTNNNISTTLECRVFNGSSEIDTSAVDGKYIYTYTWHKHENNSQVENWIKTGKTITIGRGDVSGKAIFSCTVTK